MADNMIETILKILEGVVAPSVAEIKSQVQATDQKLESQKQQMEYQFKAIMAAIETTRAQIALEHTRMYAELR